jgi:hypothetical protein
LLELKVIATANEKMHMVRHDHVPPDRNADFIESSTNVFLKELTDRFQIVDFSPMNCANGYEEQRRMIRLKNLFEPRWAVLDHDYDGSGGILSGAILPSRGRHGRLYTYAQIQL